MVISPKPTSISLLLVTILHFSLSTPYSTAGGIVPDLHQLRSQSPSGVIHLNEDIINHIFKSNSRSFYLIIFFDALQLHNQPEPNLKTIKTEFALISKSFIINSQNSSSLSKIFFCEIELGESEKQFHQFGIQALPNIRIVPPYVNDLKSDSIPIDGGDYSGLAESMADFIDSKTGLSIGRIHRPPVLSRTQLGFIIGGFLIWTPYMIKKAIAGQTVFHNQRLWIIGTVFVYFFSVSGSMFILIRRIPLFVTGRNDPNKLIFFYKGSGMQFGAEGICVGCLFTIVGLLLTFITRIVVRIRDSLIQRVAMFSAMIVSVWAVRDIVGLDHWKTGYSVHAYLPSNWY